MADFLVWLFEEKKLSHAAIKGYRSMLSLVFRFELPSLGSDMNIRDLLRSFHLSRPPSRQTTPPWDLDRVLRYLRSDSFEPLATASLRALTSKTLFLVALASAKRVGELHALSVRAVSQGSDIVLSYHPWFLAKTETASNPLPRSFVIKSLAEFVGTLEEERLLCPVRALRCYLARTKTLPARSKSLFCSLARPSAPMSKNGISYLIREVLSGAGAVEGDGATPPRAYSVRAVATSSALYRNVAVPNIMAAATWKTNSVFASFYLRDMAYSLGGTWSLGPFVAAGQVV